MRDVLLHTLSWPEKCLVCFSQHCFWRGRGEGIRHIWTIAKVNLMLYYTTVGNVTIPASDICLPYRSRPHTCSIYIYKITKIVRALWLAERSVCMTVCKHGCSVKMFCFSRANHASTNLKKKFLNSKLDKFTLFTHSFVSWYLENLYKQAMSIFFSLISWHLSEKTLYIGKHLFAKQELITRVRLRLQDIATGKNSSFNQCHNKEFCVFSREFYFIKAIENVFPVFA